MNKKVLYIIVLIMLILTFILINVSRNKSKNKKENNINITNIIKEENIIDNNTNLNEVENTTGEEAVNDVNTNENKLKNEKDNSDEKSNVQENNQAQNVTSSFDENSFANGHLDNYPNYGEQYGTIIISKIGVNAPIIFGADEETILRGVGHDSGTYFPGENSSIIMCEHDYMNNFGRLGELSDGDIIEIKTNYGDFFYQKYDEQVVLETETGKLPIQDNEEILMLYTCYNPEKVEHTPYRFVIYAKKI